MADKLATKSQQVAKRVLTTQALTTLAMSLMWLLDSTVASASSLIGGLVCIIPNGVFVLHTHRHGGAQSAKKIMTTYYQGEALKMLLTAGLFASVFIFLSVQFLPLFTTFTACLLSFPIVGITTGIKKQN